MHLDSGTLYVIEGYHMLIYSSIPGNLADQSNFAVVGATAVAITGWAGLTAMRTQIITQAAKADLEDHNIQVDWFPAGQPFLACGYCPEGQWALISVQEKIGWIVNRKWLEPMPWKPE